MSCAMSRSWRSGKPCRRVREASDRAVFFNEGSIVAPMGIGSWSGLAIFPILCLTEPDYVAELHEIVTGFALQESSRADAGGPQLRGRRLAGQ